jgi:hypothetical protein
MTSIEIRSMTLAPSPFSFVDSACFVPVLLQFCLGVEIVLNGISKSPALFPVPAASLILTPAQLLH